MKVYVMPSDAYACGHYRMVWPADVLRKQGHDIVIVPPSNDNGFQVKTVEDGDGKQTLKDVKIPLDADVIVLQRPAHPLQPQLIKMLREHGVAVVVDMDDDMSCIHPDNIAFHTYRTRSASPFTWKWAAASCKEATLVTTSTRALQKTYARPGRGAVLDNYLPAACLDFEKAETGAFGWAGTTQSHPNDLQTTGNAIQALIDQGLEFRVVGGPSKVRQAARLREDPSCTGTVDLSEWVKTIAETYDVGLIPLAATAFNTAKSRLKGVEHMAAGCAFVASPREEYRRLVKESGCGVLADTPKEWAASVKQLLSDDVLRKEQVEAGREFMKDQTYQAQAWRWLEAWSQACEMERGRGRLG